MHCCVAGIKRCFGVPRRKRASLGDLPTFGHVPSSRGRRVSEDYDVPDALVGLGGFGSVKKATDRRTGAEMIVKIIDKERFQEIIPDIAYMWNEIRCQCKCDHPHIARLIEVFEDEAQISVIMERCDGGTIDQQIPEGGSLGELDAWHILHQLMDALHYLHGTVHLAHRDVKPDNLLVKESDTPLHRATVKLIDFGFIKKFEPGRKSLTTACGTPDFMCPEIIHLCPYDEKCDIWASGVTLYQLLSGEHPFCGETCSAVLQRARDGDLRFAESAWARVSPSAVELICSMCSMNPADRPSAMGVQEQSWMCKAREEVERSTPPPDTKSMGDVAQSLSRFQKMNPFKKLALLNMGHILEDWDVPVLRNTFEMLDADGDGNIEVEDLKRELSGSVPGLSADDAEEMCKGLAQGGKIGYAAFLAANVKGINYTKASYCRFVFRMLDKNNDGGISVEELKMSMKKTPITSPESGQAREVFSQVDTNGDGRVDFDEFQKLMEGCRETPHVSFV